MMTTEIPQDTNITMECQNAEDREKYAVMIMIPMSVTLSLALSFLPKRIHLWPQYCSRRPRLLYPVIFIDDHGRRWAFACVFVLLSYRALRLYEGYHYWRPRTFNDPKFDLNFGWLSVFVNIINILIICFDFYPLLACITLRRSIIANILGFCYTLFWVTWSFLIWLACPITLDNFEAFNRLLFDIPVMIAYIGLIVVFCLDFGNNVFSAWKLRKTVKISIDFGNYSLPKDHQPMKYIQALLARKTPEDPVSSCTGKFKKKAKYTRMPGFSYSPRVVCTMVLSGLGLYKIALEFATGLAWIFNVLQVSIKEPIFREIDAFETTGDINQLRILGLLAEFTEDQSMIRHRVESIWEWVVIVFSVAWTAVAISLHLQILFMVIICLNYRKHLRKLFRGDYGWQPHIIEDVSPASALVFTSFVDQTLQSSSDKVGAMRYAGYQVAFLLCGWGLLFLVLFFVLLLFCFLVIIPLRDHESNFVLRGLFKLWPTILVGLALYFAQILVAKFFFLQDRGAYMALNNRRAFHILSYFLFFFNIILGFFSCLKRVLLSVVFGTLLISRLDRVLLMQGFEHFDTGYKCYLGMLKLDLYHNHPLVKAFLEILGEIRKERKSSMRHSNIPLVGTEEPPDEALSLGRRNRIARNRWRKALTLVNNPIILLERQQKNFKEALKQKQKTPAEALAIAATDGMASALAAVTAGVVLELNDSSL